uniref:Ig-like domain-containing protein n=2 Tax=Schistosoma mansoni TaxID=6183 RepID=A0A5K4F3B5_SCHMA
MICCIQMSNSLITGKRISDQLVDNNIINNNSSRYQFMKIGLLRYMGEEILRTGGVITQLFDAIEFSVVHERSTSYLNIQYFIGYNRSLWFTVTPCTNLLNRIEFFGSSAYNKPWEESKVYGLELSKSDIYSVNWSQQKIRIEPFPSETNLPNFTLMNQGDTILGLTRSRLHFTQIKYKTDSLNVRLYGNIGDTYNIRFSTRRSPKHALDGYPELDQTSTISVCLVQNTNDTLDISWKGVIHNSMQINYCVVINADENLYYKCTAMSRLNQLFNYYTNEKFERPKIFQDTDYLRPKLIDNYVYKCSTKSMIRIKLTPFLSQIINHLPSNNSLKLYINIYAINKRMDISTSYPVKIIQYPIELCQSNYHYNNLIIINKLYYNQFYWNSNILFQLQFTGNPLQLYYQPCYLPSNKLFNYTISLLKKLTSKNSTMTTSNLQTLCEYPINSHRVLRMCLNSGNGIYYLQLNGNPNFKNRQPVGRYFFLGINTTNLLPQKPKYTYFPTDISTITVQPSSNQTIFQIPSPFLQHNLRHYRYTNHRLKRSNHYYSLHSNNKFKSKQKIINYLIKTMNPITFINHQFYHIPNVFLKRQLRNIPYKNGFQIGVECTSHQVYISLKVHVNPQNYWIYTLPVFNDDSVNNRNLLLDYLNNNMTNYCEFPKHTLSKQIKQTIKPIYCQTTYGMHSLELTIPAYHRNDYPRFYLILIYVSNNDDINGKYKQLFVRQLLDTCNIISNGCYPKVPTECRQNYPKYLPSTFDPLMSSSVILNSNSTNQIPVCMIDEY